MKKLFAILMSVLLLAFLSTAFIGERPIVVDDDVGISMPDNVIQSTPILALVAVIGESDYSCTQELLSTQRYVYDVTINKFTNPVYIVYDNALRLHSPDEITILYNVSDLMTNAKNKGITELYGRYRLDIGENCLIT